VNIRSLITLLLLTAGASLHASDFQGATHMVPFDEDGIGYTRAEPDNAISQLQARLNAGKTELTWDEQFGYLKALLEFLGVPPSSQTLVYSKTSLQRDRISPKNPRAVYFNDDVYLGYIPGAPLVELSVADPKLGGVFYTLEQKKELRPVFRRTDQCLECHASAKSMGVPGHLVRSFITDADGTIELSSGVSMVNDRTPFSERWGGWYVSGTHGNQGHRGNWFGKSDAEKALKDPLHAGNRLTLDEFFDTRKHVEPHSDIVALMVLQHQSHLHNFLTRLHFEASQALRTYGHVNYSKSIVDGFVRYLFFADEVPLTDPVRGVSSFREEFEKVGPFDPQGRSLRQFDLHTRLFKYPCSFLIYSPAFDALPGPIKTKVYDRMLEVLSGREIGEAYAALTRKSRREILEILRATKKDLPAAWGANG